MLKYDLLESQSWLICPPTCVGQGVAPNSNLPGASLILYLNLLTHICYNKLTTNCIKPAVLKVELSQAFGFVHKILQIEVDAITTGELNSGK